MVLLCSHSVNLGGCTIPGTLTISDPQVFTRERLVKERYEERQWLHERLGDVPTEPSIQGLVDFRQFTGFHNQTKATFDPLQGALETLDAKIQNSEKQSTLHQLKSELEEAKLDSQIRKTQKRLQLAQAQRSLTNFHQGTSKDQNPMPPDRVTKGEAGSTQNNQNNSTNEDDGEITAQSASILEASQKFSVPSGNDGRKAEKVKPLTLDLFHDQLAFRNAVRAAEREKQLDDRHDLFGSTLYDLQFDLTLTPGDESPQFARIDLTLEDHNELCKLRNGVRDSTRFTFLRLELLSELMRNVLSEQSLSEQSLRILLSEILPPDDYAFYWDFHRKHLDSLYAEWADAIESLARRKKERLTQDFEQGQLPNDEIEHLVEMIRILNLGQSIAYNREQNKLNTQWQRIHPKLINIFTNLIPSLTAPLSTKFDGDEIEAIQTILKNIQLKPGKTETIKTVGDLRRILAKAEEDNPDKTLEQFIHAEIRAGAERKASDTIPIYKHLRKLQGKDKKMDIREALDNKEGTDEGLVKALIAAAIHYEIKEKLGEYLLLEEIREEGGWEIDIISSVGELEAGRPYTNRKKQLLSLLDKQDKFLGTLTKVSCNGDNSEEGSSLQLHAFSVEPKELAQNISEVGARETFLSLIASLQATLPQYGVKNAGNYSEYVRKTQEYIQNINRKPLVIGFGGGSRTFGWILGPKFQMKTPSIWRSLCPWCDSGLVKFSHIPVRHTYRASIVVPGWWTNLKLQKKFSWVNDDGEPEDGKFYSPTEKEFIHVHLPRPSDWVTRLENALVPDKTRPKPTITYPNPNSKDHVPQVIMKYDPNKPETFLQSILLQGRDLWRNPQVVIGGVKAKHVEILSDMNGLLATFDLRPDAQLETSGPEKKHQAVLVGHEDQGPLDVVVITSGGIARAPKSVVFKSTTQKPAPSCENPIKLANTYFIGNSSAQAPLKFQLDKDLFSKGAPLTGDKNPGLTLYIKGVDPTNKINGKIVDKFIPPGKEEKFTIEHPFAKYLDDQGQEKEIKDLTTRELTLTIIQDPFSSPHIPCRTLLTGPSQSLVLFKDKNDSMVNLVNAKPLTITRTISSEHLPRYSSSPSHLELTIPLKKKEVALFYKAYPGLKDALAQGSAKLRVHTTDLELTSKEIGGTHYLVVSSAVLEKMLAELHPGTGTPMNHTLTIIYGKDQKVPVGEDLSVVGR